MSEPNDDEQGRAIPDLSLGVSSADVPEGGMLLGRIGDQHVLLARADGEIFAVSGVCTHYGAALERGLLVGDTVRCPLHHACFSLRTGEALRAPALDPLTSYTSSERDGTIVVTKKRLPLAPASEPLPSLRHIVVVGGGAAGHAAVETLRREGYTGTLTLISAEPTLPCDRPNLSKDYLAGRAPEAWLSLRPPEFFTEHAIDLLLGVKVTSLDRSAQRVALEDGRSLPYDRLLLATGARPIELGVPGAHLPHVHTLRTVADARAIAATAARAKHAVVVGASFIGLEAAASLRARETDVTIVAPDARPLARIFGEKIGDFVRAEHERHDVRFRLGRTVVAVEPDAVTLDDGSRLPADLVVVGIGVRPELDLAQSAGLEVDRGIVVDAYLETNDPHVFAAGDAARWPDPRTGELVRIEHWVVAERLGQIAARNLLGRRERCSVVPFFWTHQYDFAIGYVGHANHWDRIELEGELERHSARAVFVRDDKVLAVATIGRHLDNLRAELAMEREIQEPMP